MQVSCNKFVIYFALVILADQNVEIDTTGNLPMNRKKESKIEINEFFSIIYVRNNDHFFYFRF